MKGDMLRGRLNCNSIFLLLYPKHRAVVGCLKVSCPQEAEEQAEAVTKLTSKAELL